MAEIKPKLNIFDLTMIVVSLVIGIGIFRTPAIVAASVANPFLFLSAWIVGGVISFIGALIFAEIGSRYQKAGGYYKIVAEKYNPAFAFMLNWVAIFINGAGAANVAIIGAEYLNPVIFPNQSSFSMSTTVTASTIIVLLLCINYLGIKAGAWVQNVLTVIKIIIILLIISSIFIVKPVISAQPVITNNSFSSIIYGFGVGLISVFYTYGGYQLTMNFGGDVINPKKNLPRGILLGSVIILFLYLAINYAYLNGLGFKGIITSKLVAAEIANVSFGSAGYIFISLAIFLSSLGFLNVNIMQTPRSYYAMAEDKALPKFFLRFNPKTQVQEFALLFYGVSIFISLYFLGTFEKILNYVMFTDSITIAIVASSIFFLRHEDFKKEHKGYKIILYPVLPLIFVVFLVFISINVLLSSFDSTVFGVVIFLLGYPVFRLMKRLNS
jgi:APA family basic amino acid/polyamine antiporter